MIPVLTILLAIQLFTLTLFSLIVISEILASFYPIINSKAYNNMVIVAVSVAGLFKSLGFALHCVNLKYTANASKNSKSFRFIVVICLIFSGLELGSAVGFGLLRDFRGLSISLLSLLISAVSALIFVLQRRIESDRILQQLSYPDGSAPKASRLTSYLRCTAPTLIAVGAIFAVLTFVQAAISANGFLKFPPFGEIVEIQSAGIDEKAIKPLRFHVYCSGDHNGKSTFLLEVGGGSSLLDGIALQNELSSRGRRACIYDRSGFGWSDFGIHDEPHNLRSTVNTFKLLSQIGEIDENRGLNLVAHSAGGEVIRLFANQYPDLVKGLTLVDCYPDYIAAVMVPVFNWTQKMIRADQNRVRTSGRLYEFLGSMSMLRWFWPKSQFWPSDYTDIHYEQYVNNKNWAAQMADFGQGNETTQVLYDVATLNKAQEKAIVETDCPDTKARCDIKYPKLTNDATPVLILPAASTIYAKCNTNDQRCKNQIESAKQYKFVAELYQKLSSVSKYVEIQDTTHGMFFLNSTQIANEIESFHLL